MKHLLKIFFLVSFSNCFSQTDYADVPKEYKKIHFVYQVKSNFYFDQNGFYADTTLYKIEFPNLKYVLKKHPKEESICGFVSFAKLNVEEKKKMASVIYHSNEKYIGVYNIKKNKVEIKVSRDDDAVKEFFKTVLNESYGNFYYNITLDYNRKTKTINYPLVDYYFDFVKEQVTIKYKNNISGVYTKQAENLLLTNVIDFDLGISKYITPGIVIANNDFGVKKMTTIYETTELKSVTYE